MIYEKINSLMIFLATFSDGRLYWQFLEGTNNRFTTIEALRRLMYSLDRDSKTWKQECILIHDNCPSFIAKDTKSVLKHLNCPTMLCAPASFSAILVEGIF